MAKRIAAVVVVIAGLSAGAPTWALSWSSAPAHGGGQHGGHGGHDRATPGHRLLDGEAASAELWLPTLEKRPLDVAADGTVAFKPTGIDYYHALVARRGNETAVRYIALRGRPSHRSPAELIEAPKASLEIVPTPYVREHQRYYSAKPAVFEVRFDGKPLAGQTVGLETGNGTRLFGNTDAAGRIRFELPEDFGDVEPGRQANAPAEFTLSTLKGDHRFRLTAEYWVNPHHWQSNRAGLASGLAGFVAGIGVLAFAGRRGRARA